MDSLRQKVLVCICRRRKQPARQRIDDEPVDLFWHRPVAAAQSGLDMRDCKPPLHRGERTRHGRVDIPHDHDHVGDVLIKPFVEAFEHAGTLYGMAARANIEVRRRLG